MFCTSKSRYLIFLIILTLSQGCLKFENRISRLENSVQALQSVIEAVKAYDYITSVEPIEHEGIIVGYKISFYHSNPISIGLFSFETDSILKSVDYQSSSDYIIIYLLTGESIKLPKYKQSVMPSSVVVLDEDLRFSSMGDTVQVVFRVNPSNASVNFDVSSGACQLELDEIATKGYIKDPEYFHLDRVERECDEIGHYIDGKYVAYIVDDGLSINYNETIALAINLGNEAYVSSSALHVEMDTRNFDSLSSKQEAWLFALCSKEYAGRKTASRGDSLAFELIKSEVCKMGYAPMEKTFCTTSGYLLRNLQVLLQGEIDSTIVIGSHYDGPVQSSVSAHYPAANDNASGVVTTLSVLETLSKMKLFAKPSLEFCFWDGEEVFDGSCFWGSRYYVSSLNNKKLVEYYINLDSVGHNHDLYVKHKGYKYVPHLLSNIYSNNRFSYIDIDMNETGGGSSDYVPFGNVGIPYIGFGDHNGSQCSYPSHSVNDLPEAVSLDRISKHVENIIDMLGL